MHASGLTREECMKCSMSGKGNCFDLLTKLGSLKYTSRPDIRDWCKNNFEVVKQLRMNTDSNHHR